MRTLTVVIASSFIGVAVGAAAAYAALTINAWRPQSESQSLEQIRRTEAGIVAREAAHIVVPQDIYDFGTKLVSERGTHDFVVENHGAAPLTLLVHETTCGCLTMTLSSTEVAPGQQATATAHFEAQDTDGGEFHQIVTILTNDPKKPKLSFQIKGIFVPPVPLNSEK